jgi:S-formylglutathione hydrolase FrmB
MWIRDTRQNVSSGNLGNKKGTILAILAIVPNCPFFVPNVGDIWGHLGTNGDKWGQMGTNGDIWGHLGTFIWRKNDPRLNGDQYRVTERQLCRAGRHIYTHVFAEVV